jgi:ribonuclease P protein component
MTQRFTLSKQERLCSRKIIESVFEGKKVIHLFPFSIYYQFCSLPSPTPFQIAFAVSKKNFKRAVDRNKIKRLMREAFRLNKELLTSQTFEKQIALVSVYHAREIVPYHIIEDKWKEATKQILKARQ